MAITEIEYHLTRAPREKGVLPLGGDVLTWVIDRFAPEAAREGMKARFAEIVGADLSLTKRPTAP